MIDDGTYAMVIYGIQEDSELESYTLRIGDPHIYENLSGDHGLYDVKLTKHGE